MRITEREQRDTDFDWFCVDEYGNIGHFASAGFKSVPHTVFRISRRSEGPAGLLCEFDSRPRRASFLTRASIQRSAPNDMHTPLSRWRIGGYFRSTSSLISNRTPAISASPPQIFRFVSSTCPAAFKSSWDVQCCVNSRSNSPPRFPMPKH